MSTVYILLYDHVFHVYFCVLLCVLFFGFLENCVFVCSLSWLWILSYLMSLASLWGRFRCIFRFFNFPHTQINWQLCVSSKSFNIEKKFPALNLTNCQLNKYISHLKSLENPLPIKPPHNHFWSINKSVIKTQNIPNILRLSST